MRRSLPQPRSFDPDAAVSNVFVLDALHRASKGSFHSHRRAQLVHAAEGVLVITTAMGRWVAPPQRAVWVPPGVPHAVSSRRPFRLLTLYADPGLLPFPEQCRVVQVDRLVEELLRAAALFGPHYARGGPEERLLQVILDRLPGLDVHASFHLPGPTSRELQVITQGLLENPGDRRTLGDWAAQVALTERTAARRFVAETGMTFGRWRQQARLLAAVEQLGAGESVTAVAFQVGYEDVSSFIAAFKAALGQTPARYFG